MARRDALARARGFLDFQPAARWTALATSAVTGVLCLVLLALLVFLLDLCIYRGSIPDAASADELERFRQSWPAAKRLEYLKGLPAGSALDSRDALWQAYVFTILQERVGTEAATLYRDRRQADQPRGFGILGPVVRARQQWVGQPLAWLARTAPGLWQLGVEQPNLNYLTRLAILTAVTILLLAGSELACGLAACRAAGEAGLRLRRAVYTYTFRRGSLALGPSEAVSVFTRHVEAVQDALQAWLAVGVGRLVQIGLLLLFALAVSPWLAGSLLFLAGLLMLLLRWLGGLAQRRALESVQKAAQQLALMQESLRLLRLAKSFLMDLFSQQRLDRQLSAYTRADQRRRRTEALASSVVLLIVGLAGAGWLALAGWLVLIDRGDLVGLLATALAGGGIALAAIGRQRRQQVLQRGHESAQALFAFLDEPSDVAQELDAETLPPLAQQIELDSVGLREPGGSRMLLEDVNLRIPAGRRVGLVGADEREKHALASLLPRLLDPTSGEVRFDEANLRWVTLESLRSQIGVVLRHNLVFNDSVLHNISCGAAGYNVPHITEAAKLAHAHHFIQKLPRGYETAIGELGYPLDVGEQFRIALARAVLRQPAILIIEEPPAAELDADTLALLDDTYARILAGRTVLFLPHRQATLRGCDHVILLRQGRIEAAGSHQDLLAANEYYQHLHYLEFNPFADSS